VLSGRLDWRETGGTELSVSVRYSDSDTGLPTDGAGNLVDENARLHRQLRTVGLDVGRRLGDRVLARLQLGVLERDQSSIDQPDGAADTLGVYASRLDWSVRRIHAGGRVDFELPGTTVSLGLSLEQDRGSSAYTSESEWGPYDAEAEFDRGNRGYYAQLLTEPVGGLHVTAGGFGSGFGDLGNPGLEPERSRSWEAGIEQTLGRATGIGVTWFDQRFTDLIQYTGIALEPGGPNYFNVGAAVARGLELTAGTAVAGLQLTASYTHLDTRVADPGLATDASFAEGEALLRRPAHAASLSARHQLPDGSIGATFQHVGARDDLDFGVGFPAPRRTLDAHTTVGLSAEHRVPFSGPDATVLVRVENLFDSDYQEIIGFPAPGRLIFVGARVRLGER